MFKHQSDIVMRHLPAISKWKCATYPWSQVWLCGRQTGLCVMGVRV